MSMKVADAYLYISPSSSLDVQLYTCYRFDPNVQQDMALECDYEIFSTCCNFLFTPRALPCT